jgi:hypothetical protein
VEVELWDALCTPLSGDTFAALVSLVASLQTCFVVTPAEQAAMRAAMQAPRSPVPAGSAMQAAAVAQVRVGLTLRAWRGDAKRSRGDAKRSRGDAESSLGDAESSLGDAKSFAG